MEAPKFHNLTDSSAYFRDISEVLVGKTIKSITISEDFRILRVTLTDDSKLEVESPEELTVFRLDQKDQIANIGALEFFEHMRSNWEW